MIEPDRTHFLKIAAEPAAGKPPAEPPAGPVAWLVSLFSSIWLGVTLLALLFVYMAIGSAGAPVGKGVLRPWFILNPDAWISVRELPWFELTEFEWFHWWPFDLLIALICTNLIVTTLRRIKFNAVNLGVWMIHSGIIILCLGSVWYFSTKVEGDAPVARRRIVVEAPGAEPASMVAAPGNSVLVGQGDGAYLLRVIDIDPQWELLSGDDAGQRAYKVSVQVESKTGEFTRQLLAGYPQYTEDVIRTNDPHQPMARAIKAIGKPLVDEALTLSLEYDPQEHFYLMDSHAVYLREVGQEKWVQRKIERLPRYNDYIALSDDVWQAPNQNPLTPHPIHIAVPPQELDDPLPDVTFHISRYLRYATLENRRSADSTAGLDPAATVRLQAPGGNSQQYNLVAFDPAQNNALQGSVLLAWMDSAQAIERLRTRIDPVIRFTVRDPADLNSAPIVVEHPIIETTGANPDLEFKAIEGTAYSYRVDGYHDNLNIEGRATSVAIVQIKPPSADGTPNSAFKRWVFDDPAQNRDMALNDSGSLTDHNAIVKLDPNIETEYRPGNRPPAPIMVLAGPGENDLAVMITKITGDPQITPVKVGDTVAVTEGVTLTIDRYAPRTITQTKPFIVPREQRDRDVKEHLSMVALDVPPPPVTLASGASKDSGPHPGPLPGGEGEGRPATQWLRYHNFVFDSPQEVMRRHPYQPEVLSLPDGKQVEFMFSRARMELPAPVVLDTFEVATHIGGFTGQSSSILDWKSVVRFANPPLPLGEGLGVRAEMEGTLRPPSPPAPLVSTATLRPEGEGSWSAPTAVSVNKPAEHNGFWFFQAMWDPPDGPRFDGDPGSRGLNYTVLGVGNRNGVHVQLAGCCIAVLGMIYAWYIKPVIKRRRQQKALAAAAASAGTGNGELKCAQERRAVEPVGAAWKVER